MVIINKKQICINVYIIYFLLILMKIFIFKIKYRIYLIGDWGLGIGDWGLGIGDWEIGRAHV